MPVTAQDFIDLIVLLSDDVEIDEEKVIKPLAELLSQARQEARREGLKEMDYHWKIHFSAVCARFAGGKFKKGLNEYSNCDIDKLRQEYSNQP